MARKQHTTVIVRVARLAHAAELELPAYQSAGAAGLDLQAAVAAGRPKRLVPGARALIPTGLVLELPAGFEAQVRPRSGLALEHGLTVLNSPGTIDSDYRGEVKVLLVNLGAEPFEVRRGARIAQLVIASVARATLEPEDTLIVTSRGAGGFGSTGTIGSKKKAIPRKSPSTKRASRAGPGKRSRAGA